MALQNIGTEDQAAWYEIRRNELLELLEKTSNLNISEEHAEKLAAIRKKCLENQFEIVLVGEFQGGKSTTFDTLCGGRDLSPRGLGGGGIKTSAAVISAQNISDGEEKNGMKEWAELTFKSKTELLQGMFKLFSEHANPKKFKEKIESENKFVKTVDLDNPSDRKLLQQTAEELWREKLDPDMADNLRIATLVLRFYGTKEHRALCEKTVMDVYEFQKLIAFPKDWEPRWLRGRDAQFTFDEIAFVFIARVLLRIRSEHLARLGCRITDCPGLFANDYDTRVATKTILSSDAVWYLSNGDKQLGDSDQKLLCEIRDLGVNDREFISANMRSDHDQKIADIIPTDIAILKKNDLPETVYPYNAKMAFLAEQGERLLGECLSPHDRKNMETDSGSPAGTPPEKMWLKMVRKCGVVTGKDRIGELDALDGNAIQAVREESHIEEILTPLSERIISEKARSILLDNGSTRAAKALETYEGELQAVETRAETTTAEWQRKTEESRTALYDFIEKSGEMISRSDLAQKPLHLSIELTEKLLKSVLPSTSVVDACVTSIADWTKRVSLKHCWQIWPPNIPNEILNSATPKIAEIFTRNIIGKIQEWRASERPSLWRESYHNALDLLCRDIRKNWEQKFSKDILLKGIDFEPKIDPDNVLRDLQNVLLENSEIRGNIELSWWDMIKTLFTGKELSPAQKKKVATALKTGFCNLDNFPVLREELENYFQQIFDGTVKNLKDELAAMRDKYESRLKEAEEEWKKSQTELVALAEKNRRIRTGEIEPVRKEIQAFQKQVENEIRVIEA